MSINGAPGYQFFYVHLNEDEYFAPVPSSSLSDTGVSVESFYWVDFGLPGATRVYTGRYLTVGGTYTGYRTCVRSGRGQACMLHWFFTGGTTVTAD